MSLKKMKVASLSNVSWYYSYIEL